jgi:hypothetical protein
MIWGLVWLGVGMAGVASWSANGKVNLQSLGWARPTPGETSALGMPKNGVSLGLGDFGYAYCIRPS